MIEIPLDLDVLALVALAVHGLGILMTVDAILGVRSSQGAIAWTLCLILFPYVTIPAYLIFGPRRFSSYQTKIKAVFEEFSEVVRSILDPLDNYRAQLDSDLSDDQKFFEGLSGWPVTTGNQLKLLDRGDIFFEELESLVQNAERYLLVQYYILRDDAVGTRLASLLAEKAMSGVKVYLLVDQVGSWSLGWKFKRKMRTAGIKVATFRTNNGLRYRLRLNFRNHRKLALADGKKALVGGHNIGDEYYGETKRYGVWRDTSVLLEGPVVQTLQLTFAQDWYWVVGAFPEMRWEPRPVADASQSAIAVPTGPVDRSGDCSLMLMDLISIAQTRIWIATPYLVPDDAIMSALNLASRRGLDVRIILPAVPDQVLVCWASRFYANRLTRAGIQVYRYKTGFMHQKVLLIDHRITSVGTVNIDNRSMYLNFEMSILCFSTEFAKTIEDMMRRDFAESYAVDLETIEDENFLTRLQGQFGRLFSPIL